MPVDIEEDCLVVFEGEILDIVNPIFILKGNLVSLAYTPDVPHLAWFYDAENDSIENRRESQTGFASRFMTLTGLLNHQGGDLYEPAVTKDMVIYKAVPAT